MNYKTGTLILTALGKTMQRHLQEMWKKKEGMCMKEWFRSGVVGQIGILEKEATSGLEALCQKPEIWEKQKEKSEKKHTQKNICWDFTK